MDNTPSLESRIQRLEDLAAIQNLQARYAHAVDQGWNSKQFEDVAGFFTEDATLECAAFNLHAQGNHEISKTLGQGSTFSIAQHSFTNPVIEVTGNRATGQWLLWVGVRSEAGANMVFESEELEYVRTPDGWKIQSLKLYVAQMLKDPAA